MKKKGVRICIGVMLCIFLALLTAALIFYFVQISPRLNVLRAIEKAFMGDEAGDVLEILLGEDGALKLSTEEGTMSASLSWTDSVLDGLKFGYTEEGLWFCPASVSEKNYLLPWTDDVAEQISDSDIISLLGLDDEDKTVLADGLGSLKTLFLSEDESDFSPTFLNRLLGLEDLEVDVLELYENIAFKKAGTEGIETEGETYLCTKYILNIPENYISLLFNTDGAGKILNVLGRVLGDAYVEVYICDLELISMSVDTSIELEALSNVLDTLSMDEISLLTEIDFSEVSLQIDFLAGSDGYMNAYILLGPDGEWLSGDFSFAFSDTEVTWEYDKEQEFNIFEASLLEFLWEVAKWRVLLDG